MRLKILFLMIFLLSVNVHSQDQKIEVEISLKNPNVRMTAKSVQVKVKITNMSDRTISTSDFEWLGLSLSKCPQADKCQVRGETSVASAVIKSERLKKYQSVEFEVDLANLYWNDITSSVIDFNQPKNLITVPFTHKYLSAKLAISSEKKEISGFQGKVPIIQSADSNVIEIKLMF